jgi:hypothetical protein
MIDQLKPLPCPFCLDSPIHSAFDSQRGTWFECIRCLRSGPLVPPRTPSDIDSEVAEALRLWNERVLTIKERWGIMMKLEKALQVESQRAQREDKGGMG